MLNSFIFSLNATLPIFLMMIIGYILRQIKLLDEPFINASNKLVFRVALPSMLFLNLYDTDIRHNFNLRYIGFCFIVTFVSITALWWITRKVMRDKSLVGEFVQCAYRSSAAILGAAFIINIYGNTGMTPMMIIGSVPLYNIFAVMVLLLESPNGQELSLGPRLRQAFIGILTNPIILGIIAGLTASLINLELAPIPHKVLSNLSSIATPLGLISMGAAFDTGKAFGQLKPAVISTFIKTVLLTAIFLPLALAAGFRDQELIAIVIMLGSPTTISCYIMARNMGHEGVLTSTCVMFSTLFSSVSLTFWIFLIRYMGWIAA